MISLKEQIEFEVSAVLLEMRTGFDIRKFKSLTTFDEQYDYAMSKLQVLGEGSSRIVFLLSNRTVLKMARRVTRHDQRATNKGKAQNEAEVDAYTDPRMQPVLAKVFDFDKREYNWLISELVRPLSYKEFLEFVGISNEEYLDAANSFLWNASDDIQGAKWLADEEIKEAEENLEDAKMNLDMAEESLAAGEIPETALSFIRAMVRSKEKLVRQSKEIRDVFDTRFFRLIVELENEFEILTSDTRRPDHWGKTADGRVVLLDYGYTESIEFLYYGG